MSDSFLFYVEIAGVGAVMVLVWLFVSDLRQGKKFRFDSANKKQKSAITSKGAWVGFSWRALPSLVVICVGIFDHLPFLIVLGLFSIALNLVVLTKMLRLSKEQTVVK